MERVTIRQGRRIPSRLLALPAEILLSVARFLAAAGEQRSLLSAARAHSKLRRAAVTVLSSIAAQGIKQQQQINSVALYLTRHGKHVSSISLVAGLEDRPRFDEYLQGVFLDQLPPTLQLKSLHVENLPLQLQPVDAFGAVLGTAPAAVSALTQLRLHNCELLDGIEGLAAVLSQLPSLEHLSISVSLTHHSDEFPVTFPTGVLHSLQHLTYLELQGCWATLPLQGPDPASPALQPLQALTRLRDLRLFVDADHKLPTGVVCTLLTRLQLNEGTIDPGVLTGRSQLQHLELVCEVSEGAAWEAQLLSQLQHCQHLTHLCLEYSLRDYAEAKPPAAAYAALTASSSLCHLDIRGCTLPEGVWQHMFPPGMQLPHLTWLDIGAVGHGRFNPAAAPDGSRLVSCCPALQHLNVRSLKDCEALLPALQGLSQLHSLHTVLPHGSAGVALEALAQLTQLRDLETEYFYSSDPSLAPGLLQLTALQQLTYLRTMIPPSGWQDYLRAQAPGDEPVWRQLLRRLLDCGDPDVAQQAAAALAE